MSEPADLLHGRMAARALHEGRSLASVVGVPEASIAAAHALARWAAQLEHGGLAIAAWEGCAALDDRASSWLALADTCLAAGDGARAWDAAARVSTRTDASADERAHAHLVLGRVCLALERPEAARAHLALVREGPHALLARAIERALDAREARG